jgi:hypothetical protein
VWSDSKEESEGERCRRPEGSVFDREGKDPMGIGGVQDLITLPWMTMSEKPNTGMIRSPTTRETHGHKYIAFIWFITLSHKQLRRSSLDLTTTTTGHSLNRQDLKPVSPGLPGGGM